MTTSETKGGLWRPANATEGNDFEHNWCRHCVNRDGAGDWEDEFGNDIDGSCVIAEAMFWSPKFQPPELVMRHDMPWCLAFRQEPTRPARCLFTQEMSLGSHPQAAI